MGRLQVLNYWISVGCYVSIIENSLSSHTETLRAMNSDNKTITPTTEQEIISIVAKQREYFKSGATKSYESRIDTIDARLEVARETLERQYIAMETALAQLEALREQINSYFGEDDS